MNVKKQYQDMCQEVANNLGWYYPTEYADDLDPPDADEGNQTKF